MSLPELEKRCQLLRNQLADLEYYQPLSPEAVPLTERLLGDLIRTVQSYQDMQKKNSMLQDQNANLKKELETALAVGPRLQKENSDLHAEKALEAEENLKKFRVIEKELLTVKDANEQYQLLLQHSAASEARVEAENANLRKKLGNLIGLKDDDIGGVLTIKGWLNKSPGVDLSEGTKSVELSPLLAAENNRLRGIISQFETQTPLLKKKITELEERNFVDNSSPNGKELSQLQAKFDFLNEKYEEAKRRLTTDTTSELKNKLATSEENVLILKSDVRRLESLLSGMTGDGLSLSGIEKSTESALKNALDRERRLRHISDKKIPDSDPSLQTKVTMLSKELELERQAVASLTRRLNALPSSSGESWKFVPEDLTEVRSLLAEKTTQLQQLSSENKSLQSTLNSLMGNKRSNTPSADLAVTISRLSSENASLREKLISLESSLHAKSREFSEIEKTLNSRSETVTSLQRELSAARSEISDLREKIRASEISIQKWEGEVGRVGSERDRLRSELESMKNELIARVGEFESAVTSIQGQVITTAEENKKLTSLVKRLESEKSCEINTLTGASAQLSQLSEAVEALGAENVALQDQLSGLGKERDDLAHDLSQALSQLHASGMELRARQEEGMRADSALEIVRRDLRVEISGKQAAMKEAELARAKVNHLESSIVEKEKQISQLRSLSETVESAREQLAFQLVSLQSDLENERRSHNTAISRGGKANEEVALLLAEISSLKESLVRLDSDRDSLQRTADEQAERIDSLIRENRRVALEGGESSRNFENLRRQLEVAEHGLDEANDSRKSLERRLNEALNECTSLASQLAMTRRDLSDAMDDISVVTRENQKAADSLGEAAREASSLTAALRAKERSAQELMQALRATELERDDILGLYRKTAEEAGKQQASLLAVEAERAAIDEQIQALSEEVNESRRMEEAARHRVRQAELDTVALKRQLSELTARLELAADESEEGRRGLHKAMADLKHSQEVTRQVEIHRERFERETAALQAQNNNMIGELQKLKMQLSAERNEAEQAIQRTHSLERLVADMRAEEGRQAKSSASQSQSGFMSPLPPSEDVGELYRTIEQQYALIGEMDAELERLRASSSAQ